MRIIGIDLSFTGTGLVVVETETKEVVHHTVVATDKRLSDIERSIQILTITKRMAQAFEVDVFALEDYAFQSKGDYTLRIAECCGIFKEWMHYGKKTCYIVAISAHKKQFTGKGNASKVEMVEKMKENYPELPEDNNIADALSVALWVIENKEPGKEYMQRNWGKRTAFQPGKDIA